MDEKRKAWCEKYKVDIIDGGFIDEYCMPEHVECILPGHFIGFDGTKKTYEQLTNEEKEDYEQQCKPEIVEEKLQQFLNKRRALKNNLEER